MADDGSLKLAISPNDFRFRGGISYETGESFAEFR